MKELEKAIDQLKKENDRIEKAQNRAKLLNQKINKLKRNAETKRKVQKGGVFEAFEREITGMQEETRYFCPLFLTYLLAWGYGLFQCRDRRIARHRRVHGQDSRLPLHEEIGRAHV